MGISSKWSSELKRYLTDDEVKVRNQKLARKKKIEETSIAVTVSLVIVFIIVVVVPAFNKATKGNGAIGTAYKATAQVVHEATSAVKDKAAAYEERSK